MGKVSIVIPTRNGGDLFVRVLEMLARQSKAHELIVIDSESSDGSADAARSHGARVIVIPAREFDHGGTRTRAAMETTGDVIVMMSQDALPADEQAIANLVAPIERDPMVCAAYGRQLPANGASAFAAHLRIFNYPAESSVRTMSDTAELGIKAIFLSNSFAAYRRSALSGLGWFPSGLIMCEDTTVAAKMLIAGYKVAYAADARVYHSHNYSIMQDFRRYFDTGVLHTMEHWLIEDFGGAKGQGLKYVISEFKYLMRRFKIHLIPSFFIRNFMKYAGYQAGCHYKEILPAWRKRLSMHSRWWDKESL